VRGGPLALHSHARTAAHLEATTPPPVLHPLPLPQGDTMRPRGEVALLAAAALLLSSTPWGPRASCWPMTATATVHGRVGRPRPQVGARRALLLRARRPVSFHRPCPVTPGLMTTVRSFVPRTTMHTCASFLCCCVQFRLQS
jgi:hypothetical protein